MDCSCSRLMLAQTRRHVVLDLCVQAVVASFDPFVKYQTALSSESRRSVVVSHNQ